MKQKRLAPDEVLLSRAPHPTFAEMRWLHSTDIRWLMRAYRLRSWADLSSLPCWKKVEIALPRWQPVLESLCTGACFIPFAFPSPHLFFSFLSPACQFPSLSSPPIRNPLLMLPPEGPKGWCITSIPRLQQTRPKTSEFLHVDETWIFLFQKGQKENINTIYYDFGLINILMLKQTTKEPSF